MKHKLPISGLLLALFLACTSDSEDGLGSGQAAACVAGKVEPCACPGTAVQGAQTCLPSGAFGACEGCPGGTAGGAGGAGQGGENQGGSAPGGEGGADVFGPGGTNAGGSISAGNGGSATSGNGGSATGGNGGSATGGSGGSATGGSASGGTDQDGDGWTTTQGDCNDKDPAINPGAAELLEVDFLGKPKAEQIDNDCDGKALQPNDPTACDAGLGPILNDPFDGARAMGLCKIKVDENSRKWGVISATLSDIGGEPLSGGLKATGKAREHAIGLLPNLGPNTPSREGQRLFALSTGIARAPGQPGWSEVSEPLSYSKNYTSGQPNGFPKTSTCATPGTPNDGVALDLKIRVPSNARSMRFKYRFFAADYPQYTCDQFNDVFAVLMSPSPLGAGDPMADGQNLSANIVFENTSGGKKTIGVNNESFFSACEPGANNGVYPSCKAGNGAQLQGSGFETHGATSWLVNQTSVPPGGILYLRFAIWDSADGILDSTVVIDDFEWSTSDPQGAKNLPENAAGGAGGAGGSSGGAGGSAGSGGGLFGGSGGSSAGSGLFGGSAGSGTAGSSTAGSSSGGNGSGGAAGVPGPCPDGSCAGPGQCCLNPGPPAQCGQDFSGLLCL